MRTVAENWPVPPAKSVLLGVALAVAIVSLVVPGHADVPGWVNNPDERYPSATYLTAVGSAPTLAAARKKAKAELSKIFSQRIQAIEELDQHVEETSRGKTTTFVENVQQRTEISVKTSAELIGVRIERTREVFRDGQSRSYALAVLNKDQAASLYRDRYLENRRQLRASYRAARTANDPIRRLRLLAEARNFGETARRYQNQYAVLKSFGATTSGNSTAVPEERLRENARAFAREMEQNLQSDTSGDTRMNGSFRTPSVPEIERRIEGLMADLSLEVSRPTLDNFFAGSDFADQLRGVVEEQFTSLGFRTTSQSENPDVTVSLRLSAEPTSKGRPGDYAIAWNITLRMVSSHTGQSFGTMNESGVSVGLDESMARSRTRDDIVSWVRDNLTALIVEKLLST